METKKVNDSDQMIFIFLTCFSLFTLSFGDLQISDDGFDERFPEENAGLFEGDIELTGVNPFNRNAIGNKNRLWPKRIVPYRISHHFSSHTRHTIRTALKDIEAKTRNCIHFVPKQNNHYYSMSFVSGRGCHSQVGFTGTHQSVTLGNGCLTKGIIIHETLHSLGFFHEQSRPDRDNYIEIIRSNIIKGKERNFRKLFPPIIDTQNLPYDYGSIMHYGRHSFAKDRRKPTIVPRKHNVKIGQRYGLSVIDIQQIRKLYGCS